jgi:antitoxin component YwqK of YwqJK toxin-antitoxin module
MKNIILTVFVGLFLSLGLSAQELTYDQPLKVENKQYTLIDVDSWGHTEILVETFNNEGELVERGVLKNNKRHGVWTMYSNNRISAEMEFNNDRRVWLKVYKENGFTHVTYMNNRPYVVQTETRLASN